MHHELDRKDVLLTCCSAGALVKGEPPSGMRSSSTIAIAVDMARLQHMGAPMFQVPPQREKWPVTMTMGNLSDGHAPSECLLGVFSFLAGEWSKLRYTAYTLRGNLHAAFGCSVDVHSGDDQP